MYLSPRDADRTCSRKMFDILGILNLFSRDIEIEFRFWFSIVYSLSKCRLIGNYFHNVRIKCHFYFLIPSSGMERPQVGAEEDCISSVLSDEEDF